MAKPNKKNTGRFAGVPFYIMESGSYVNLSPLAKSLLYELCGQYNGKNNGYLSLTRNDLSIRGFRSTNSNFKAINALVEAGIITQTKGGGIAMGRRACNLYALNYQPMDEKLDKPLDNGLPFKGSHKSWFSTSTHRVPMLVR